jgi:Protein of unknown function (DUF4231)
VSPRKVKERELGRSAQVVAELVKSDSAMKDCPERLRWAEDRWLYGVSHLGRGISNNRKTVYWLRGITGFGALLVPILATAAANSPSAFWRWSTVGVSFAVALCTAIDQVVRPAARWRLVRHTRGVIEGEGWAFLQQAGRYANLGDDERFHELFSAVEKAWEEHERVYLNQIAHEQNVPRAPRKDVDNGS